MAREPRKTTRQQTENSRRQAEEDAARRGQRRRRGTQRGQNAPPRNGAGPSHSGSNAMAEREVKEEIVEPASPTSSILDSFGFENNAPDTPPRRPQVIARRVMTKVYEKAKKRGGMIGRGGARFPPVLTTSIGETSNKRASNQTGNNSDEPASLPITIPTTSNTESGEAEYPPVVAVETAVSRDLNAIFEAMDILASEVPPVETTRYSSNPSLIKTASESTGTVESVASGESGEPGHPPVLAIETDVSKALGANSESMESVQSEVLAVETTRSPSNTSTIEESFSNIAIMDSSRPAELTLPDTSLMETVPTETVHRLVGVEMNGKRKVTEEGATGLDKRARNEPEDVNEGKFSAFYFQTNPTKPTSEWFIETLSTFLSVEISETNQILLSGTHCKSSTLLWYLPFKTSGEFTRRLTSLLNHPNRAQELDLLNEKVYGGETSKYLHISQETTITEMTVISYLLLVQRIVGFIECCVDGTSMLGKFGKRMLLAEVLSIYPEAAAKAYEQANRFTRKELNKIIEPEMIGQLQGSQASDTNNKLMDAYRVLNTEGNRCSSLLKKHLTMDIIKSLKARKTNCGKNLYHCVISGVKNLEARIGVFAPSPDAYNVFSPFMNKIIEEYHTFGSQQQQPAVNLGEGSQFPPIDPEDRYVISTRIRCIRNLRNYPFNAALTKNEYLNIEGLIKSVCAKFKHDDIKGEYFPVSLHLPEDERNFFGDHFLHGNRCHNLRLANALRHWPCGRGIFRNRSKTFLILMNIQDHLRFVSIEKGSDVGRVLDRLNTGLNELGPLVSFARDRRLGWLTNCPSTLGSTVRASVLIRLPRLAANGDIDALGTALNLTVRKVEGQVGLGTNENAKSTFIIGNKRVLGISESDAISEMCEGVKKLIVQEKSLEEDFAMTQ